MNSNTYKIVVEIIAKDKDDAEEKAKLFSEFSATAGVNFLRKCLNKLQTTKRGWIESYFEEKLSN